jgi:hypothetical protein
MNFKKHISIYLALFILLVNSSASLVLHFCNDQIAYVSLVYHENKLVDSATEDSCCATEDANDEKGCCSNEEIKVEKKIEYSITKDFSSSISTLFFENQNTAFSNKTCVLSLPRKTVPYYCNSNAPPFYKLYSQLIFYA